jgi:L-2-hydroxyglutarate oxidase LhgO
MNLQNQYRHALVREAAKKEINARLNAQVSQIRKQHNDRVRFMVTYHRSQRGVEAFATIIASTLLAGLALTLFLAPKIA